MSECAISIDNLGKLYRIGESQHYTNLREKLTAVLRYAEKQTLPPNRQPIPGYGLCATFPSRSIVANWSGLSAETVPARARC
jgi:hypothetical protein